jgi:hypothetical protein
MNKEQELYLHIGRNINEAQESQMFGKPCFKINGKAFICFFQDCLVCKLAGTDHKDALSLDGAVLFDPAGKGRAMKEWVQIPYTQKENWGKFAHSAAEYVKSISK